METKVNLKGLALKWGLILGLMLTIVSLVVNIMGLYGNSSAIQLASLALLVLALIFGMREYRDQNNGFMSFGQGTSLGLLVLLVSSIFSNIISYIYMKYIDPEIIDKIMEMQLIQMENQGLSDREIDQAMEMTKWMMTPEMLVFFSILAFLFFGGIISMIIAGFLKKNEPITF